MIEETLTNDSTNERKTSRTNSSSAGGGLTAADTSTSGTKRKIDKINGLLGIGYNTTSSNSFKGKAESSIDEEFVTTVSATIEQTYQNGNYFIKGSKDMMINGQMQTIKISGVIRPYDITPDNTVSSNQLANLKIVYEKSGSENESIEKPWGTRFLESISPF